MKLSRIIPILILLCLLACDKMDDNGKLDGNWQLTRWTDNATGEVKADNSSKIFYTVKLQLIQFADQSSDDWPFIATFSHKGDSLILTNIYAHRANTDSIASATDLQRFGVSSDGRFAINELTGSRMTLRNSTNTLTFRKY